MWVWLPIHIVFSLYPENLPVIILAGQIPYWFCSKYIMNLSGIEDNFLRIFYGYENPSFTFIP